MANKNKPSTRIDKTLVDLDKDNIQSKQLDNLHGQDLAKQLRADLGGSDPQQKDVFAHRKKVQAAEVLRDKLSTLNSMDLGELEQHKDLPENLSKKLKRLDDLAKPKEDHQPDFSIR